jgi:hypothetical protein
MKCRFHSGNSFKILSYWGFVNILNEGFAARMRKINTEARYSNDLKKIISLLGKKRRKRSENRPSSIMKNREIVALIERITQ